jgi:hypothetical protein
VNSVDGTDWNWTNDTPGIRAVPLGLELMVTQEDWRGIPTQGCAKARTARLASALGCDRAVPLGRKNTMTGVQPTGSHAVDSRQIFQHDMPTTNDINRLFEFRWCDRGLLGLFHRHGVRSPNPGSLTA